METTPTTTHLFELAQKVIPGGVNSPVRACTSMDSIPRFIASAKGAQCTDVEGNQYIDYVMSWGPLMFGHVHTPIEEAAIQAVRLGSTFGAPTLGEVQLAQVIIERLPWIDQVRCVSSGTEAVMTALRLARGYTGRNTIIKFDGHYHGHADSVLVAAGSGVATLGLPNSPGVTPGASQDTIVLPWNDPDALSAAFATHGPDIAAVIYEPIACNVGCIPAQPGMHELIRTLATDHGALVIVDEVMTGFRVDYRGAVGLYGLEPDLVTFGKVIGGGFPLAALGGRYAIMQHLAPVGPVYQAGTLSGNPVAVAAGRTQLELLTPELYTQLTQTAAALTSGLADIFAQQGIPAQLPRVNSMFALYFADEPVRNAADAKAADHARFADFYRHMIGHGVMLPPSGFEAWFVSTSHTGLLIEQTLQIARRWTPQR